MKIGLIGNMNNNSFALMRYFRDLGADAHLLLNSNDGANSLSHFTPEADTWHLKNWAPFIHETGIPNAPVAALDFPLSIPFSLRSCIFRMKGNGARYDGAVTRKQINRAYHNYDRLIGSGIAPATLDRVGKALNIFYPYAMGVEFLDSYEDTYRRRLKSPAALVSSAVRKKQLKGLMRTATVFSFDAEITGKILEQEGIKPVQQTMPMVYNREPMPAMPPTETLALAYSQLKNSDFSMLHHARLHWSKKETMPQEEHWLSNKNNDKFIVAFAKLVEVRRQLRPRLFIVEYGPDVERTKALVNELSIEDRVTWLPKMARRELLWLLSRVSIGVGEFYEVPRMIWGGTGWEALATGTSLLQSFLFETGEFEQIYGVPAPPLLGVSSANDLLEKMLLAADDPNFVSKLGDKAQRWYDTHNGIKLAQKWLDLTLG